MAFAAVKGHAHVCQVNNKLSFVVGYVAKKTILIICPVRFRDLCTLPCVWFLVKLPQMLQSPFPPVNLAGSKLLAIM